jgi:hypothetical protein
VFCLVGFSSYRTRVLDEQRPLAQRCQNFLHAIESFTWLTNTSFHSVLSELESVHGFEMRTVSDAGPVVAAFRELEAARSEFLVVLSFYWQRRKEEKRRGRRTADPFAIVQVYRRVTLGDMRPSRALPAQEANPPESDGSG